MDISEVKTSSQQFDDLGYTDELLRAVGDMISGDWMKLGTYLGIPKKQLDSMIVIKRPQEMVIEMFQLWWKDASPHARWGELHHALMYAHRVDMVKRVQRYCRDFEVNYNFPDSVTISKMFEVLAEYIPREWKEIGICLGLSMDQLRDMEIQPVNDISKHAYKVLKMWQTLPLATHHQLIKVMLDDMKLGLVTRFILDTLDIPKEGRTVCDCGDC